jgi:hypothetical protein
MDAKEEARIDMEGQRPAHPVLLRESERSVTLAIIAGKSHKRATRTIGMLDR